MHGYFLFQFLAAFFKSDRQLAWENAFLRYQLAIAQRSRRRIWFRKWDRLILCWLSRRTVNWKEFLVIITPETLIRWHRKAFSLVWSWNSGSGQGGRPEISDDLKKLISEISLANPLWGIHRVHGELKKLGIRVAPSTVQKYMTRKKRGPSNNWKTFIENHKKELVAIDFFAVPTLRFRMLWTLIVFSPDRRKILHYATTYRHSPEWTLQQMRNLCSFQDFPKMIVHDRDRSFLWLKKLGITEIITGYRCPWQNGYVERVIGTIRRECTDHLIVFGQRHLERILEQYARYYNDSRTHLSLDKDAPNGRTVQDTGTIFSVPQVGGLHHRYERRAA